MTTTHLNAAKFAEFDGRKYTSVDIAGLGKVRLGSLSARRGFEFRKMMERQEKGENMEMELTRLLLVGSIVDDAGQPVFDDSTAESFLDRISPDMSAALLKEVTTLMKLETPKENAANPSSASTSAS